MEEDLRVGNIVCGLSKNRTKGRGTNVGFSRWHKDSSPQAPLSDGGEAAVLTPTRHILKGGSTMLKMATVVVAAGLFSAAAYAAQDVPSAAMQTAIPQSAVTVTDWYKQNVYDPSDTKIGEIMDVLVDKSGQINTLIVGVGGFLGAGEKDVAVPFTAVHATMKDNNKMYLVMNATKDSLKNAPGFKYDSNTTTWVPENKK
jgi:sporulation protein YlmC with PRC-barrel domain